MDMVSLERNSQHQTAWPAWRLLMLVLTFIALIISAILSWHFLKGGAMIGCSGGSACDQVLNSKWSSVAGILPVSSLAMGVYLAMLVAVFFIGPDTEQQVQSLSWKVLLVLAGAIAGSAIWFIFVQKWFIGNFCPYCMTEHITGLLLAALITWQARKVLQKKSRDAFTNAQPSIQNVSMVKSSRTSLRLGGLMAIGLLLSGMLVAGQIVFKPKSIYQSGASHDNLTDIDYKTAPIIGSPNAPYVVKLLFDYECPHCQQIHFMLNEAVRRYAGKLAFVLCPSPLNTQCNPYISRDVDAFKNSCELARIGLKVWAANRDAYTVFENWMFTFESGDKWEPRSIEAARAKAVGLIGEKFNDGQYNDWVENYIQTCVQIYGETIRDGKSGIPKLVYGSKWVIPQPNNEDDLITILQKSLALPKP
jgi:uncharacterized membrane protein/protein-disulfide isomerase